MIAAYFVPVTAGQFINQALSHQQGKQFINGISNIINMFAGVSIQHERVVYHLPNVIIGMVLMVFIIALPFMFAKIGKPIKADEIDEKAATALGLVLGRKWWHNRPFLTAIKRARWSDKSITSKHIIDYVFRSIWFNEVVWKDENVLNAFCHSMSLARDSVEVIKSGRKGYWITIRAIKLFKVGDGAATHDPLFKD
jgi:hypothetical protein